MGSWYISGDERKPFFKKYLRRARKLLVTKLYGRNLIKGINTWAVTLVRYPGRFLKWTKEEPKQMDQRRKLKMMHETLYFWDDVDGIYMSRKEGGRGLTKSIDASIQKVEDYTETRGERLITAIRNKTGDTRINRTNITRKQIWEEKIVCGRFKQLTNGIG